MKGQDNNEKINSILNDQAQKEKDNKINENME